MAEDLIDQEVSVGTLHQIETFHRYVFSDLFKEEKRLTKEKEALPKEKKYYVVPLRLVSCEGGSLEYAVDTKLLRKVEQISMNGYEGVQ